LTRPLPLTLEGILALPPIFGRSRSPKGNSLLPPAHSFHVSCRFVPLPAFVFRRFASFLKALLDEGKESFSRRSVASYSSRPPVERGPRCFDPRSCFWLSPPHPFLPRSFDPLCQANRKYFLAAEPSETLRPLCRLRQVPTSPYSAILIPYDFAVGFTIYPGGAYA